ncbi:putative uncharacterized protein C7orf78 homolog [Tenrec ecaudatus]|uniref:putative uncharacterized protein C7orf78 homolog n=1 Tax=Tenrec ecaudatus TaxID=94439 RepID=UPI003F5A6C89
MSLKRALNLPFNKVSTPNGKKKWNDVSQSDPKPNIWEIKPPDFSYKQYTSLRFPEKKPRNIKKERRKPNTFPEATVHLPSIRNEPAKSTAPRFITTFAPLDAFKEKTMIVKQGKYPSGVYLDPKPPDFRQYQANLPNFVTTYEKDPFGLKFKSRHLSTVYGSQLLKDDKQKNGSERFITYMARECSWDSSLILPKDPWPVRSASFTRHRRERGAYSAFMDRVEEKFSKAHKNR